MFTISTHILDASLGQPLPNVLVQLFYHQAGQYQWLDSKSTDQQGRIQHFRLREYVLGEYQLRFELEQHELDQVRHYLYPRICIDFRLSSADQHYHLPLLLSPFSYTTYRGC
ncbi:hydroxyisourate hydrolase [Acinetobacter larvae]|uniref:5-hydroxyisourate hydrolase n=1 Tax=Acinetobacter larvae TaxID=1789224 RepID=A0A1B2LYS9_9GAMM|nr:hydroxyisourate hydrolase [Acinetobacter larvae]AOA58081.1 hydroxyisourate hydrolase [Acinetobacter larvae]